MYPVCHHRFQPGEPAWRDVRSQSAVDLPRDVRPWLLDTGSLTARLTRASRGDFKVRVLEQSWQRPHLSERRLLGMADRGVGIVREVMLLCHGDPWVFARSVMPAQSLEGRLQHLRKLKDSALGALLFSDPTMRRAPYELAAIAGDDPGLPAELRTSETLWGRRSCFYLSDKPIMVSEIFLPAFNG